MGKIRFYTHYLSACVCKRLEHLSRCGQIGYKVAHYHDCNAFLCFFGQRLYQSLSHNVMVDCIEKNINTFLCFLNIRKKRTVMGLAVNKQFVIVIARYGTVIVIGVKLHYLKILVGKILTRQQVLRRICGRQTLAQPFTAYNGRQLDGGSTAEHKIKKYSQIRYTYHYKHPQHGFRRVFSFYKNNCQNSGDIYNQ